MIAGWRTAARVVGFNLLLYSAALSALDRSTIEAARIDRAGPAQIVRHVIASQLVRPTVRIGLLNNSVAEWEPLRAELLTGVDVFDAAVRSHEVGFGKPDPRICTLADARLPPESGALLIDDIPANTDAARRRGWSAIDHRSTASTIARLASLRTRGAAAVSRRVP